MSPVLNCHTFLTYQKIMHLIVTLSIDLSYSVWVFFQFSPTDTVYKVFAKCGELVRCRLIRDVGKLTSFAMFIKMNILLQLYSLIVTE